LYEKKDLFVKYRLLTDIQLQNRRENNEIRGINNRN